MFPRASATHFGYTAVSLSVSKPPIGSVHDEGIAALCSRTLSYGPPFLIFVSSLFPRLFDGRGCEQR